MEPFIRFGDWNPGRVENDGPRDWFVLHFIAFKKKPNAIEQTNAEVVKEIIRRYDFRGKDHKFIRVRTGITTDEYVIFRPGSKLAEEFGFLLDAALDAYLFPDRPKTFDKGIFEDVCIQHLDERVWNDRMSEFIHRLQEDYALSDEDAESLYAHGFNQTLDFWLYHADDPYFVDDDGEVGVDIWGLMDATCDDVKRLVEAVREEKTYMREYREADFC